MTDKCVQEDEQNKRFGLLTAENRLGSLFTIFLAVFSKKFCFVFSAFFDAASLPSWFQWRNVRWAAVAFSDLLASEFLVFWWFHCVVSKVRAGSPFSVQFRSVAASKLAASVLHSCVLIYCFFLSSTKSSCFFPRGFLESWSRF